MAYIEKIEASEAEGELKQTYRLIEEKRGKVADIFKIHSLKPKVMKTHLDMYLSVLFDAHGLSRRERETVAVAVSQENVCGYCVEHHSQALSRYEHDRKFVSALRSGSPRTRNAREKEMIRFARKLTVHPADMTEDDIERLKKAGLGDREILDLTLVTAYFNFVNRIANATGLEASPEETKGYRY